MEFSLFFFDGDGSTTQTNKYQFLLDSVKFADQAGFTAIWTPERHFHPFGGLYPNPSVIGAALAMVTQQVQIRAGSVVLPLHNPARVAEEWAIVDNLSQGRVAIAFASGWTVDDFVLSSVSYGDRREALWQQIPIVQRLWAGESADLQDANGKTITIRTYPRPLQAQLPIWVTCQSARTFVEAGKLGANVLTSLLSGTLDDVATHIKLYRQSLAAQGYDPETRKVAIMLHTFIGEDFATVKEQVRQPFCVYLKAHLGLLESLARGLNLNVRLETFSDDDINSLLKFAYDGYLRGRTLIGSPATCQPMIERLVEAGVDEIACLVDFGMDFDAVMASLSHLNTFKASYTEQTELALST